MRKLLSIFSLALVAILAIGCDDHNNEQGGGNNNGGNQEVTFAFGQPEATSTSIEILVMPSDDQINYFAGIVPASEIATMDDATIITEYLQSFSMRKGTQLIGAQGLTPETDYMVIAFAYGATDKVSKVAARTAEAGAVSEGFYVDIAVNDITSNSAIAVARPNDNDTQYFFRVLTQLELREFGILNNDLEIFKYIIENPNSNSFIFKGEKTLEYTNLSPKMDYIAVAFNVDTYEDVLAGIIEIELFRYEFTTEDAPQVDPNTLFTYANLEVDHTGFSLDVTPVKGEDKLWAYYIFEKRYFDEYMAKGRQQVVMRAYFGLYNLGQEYNIINHTNLSFNEFITEYMGQYGSTEIINYEPLKPEKEYVVAMFYMDPEVYDPTIVYDYNFVSVNFKTAKPDDSLKVQMDVVGPVIEKEGFSYSISFNVAVDNNAVSLKYGATEWNENVEKYYDPNDCNSIRAFVNFTTANDEVLTTAKTEDGATIEYSGITEPFNGVFMFEAANSQGAVTQYMVRVTPDQFE